MKTKAHRHDEPTVIPTDCVAVVFRPDGLVEMILPPESPKDRIPATMVLDLMRAAILFGDGRDSEAARAAVDRILGGVRSSSRFV